MSRQVTIPEVHKLPLGRTFEILPGLAAWLFLLSPIYLSFLAPVALAYMIIAYDLLWLGKAALLSRRLIFGYRKLHRQQRVNWRWRLEELKDLEGALDRVRRRLLRARLTPEKRRLLQERGRELEKLLERQVDLLNPDEIYQAVIIATYNEAPNIIEPTLRALSDSDYPGERLIVLLAYEERGGPEVEQNAKALMKKYDKHFLFAKAIKHPAGLPGEAKAKAGNITYAGKFLTDWVAQEKLNQDTILVTTLDADNRPEKQFFSQLAYLFATAEERHYKSYQPMPMFFNNIWHVPAAMRVIATGNSFWQLMESMRPHRLRNFSAHAQSLRSLVAAGYWNVQSIVEDGHQYWRNYFAFDGNHSVVPVHAVILQDAVLAKGYLRTFKVQFYQLRRWAWGVSDIPFFVVNARRNKKISLGNKILQFIRLFEGHFSWATAPMILLFAAWMPLILNPQFSDQILAHQLPVLASRIQTLATFGILTTVLVSIISLPPRPRNYGKLRYTSMILQWLLLPITSIIFGSLAALNAQTRLMFGWYLEDFEVTEKYRGHDL